MAQPVAPTDDSSAGTRAGRRLNQDYMKMYQFLSLGVWRHLGSSESQRSKAEVLCEFLYLNLEMRLPTEPTLGQKSDRLTCILPCSLFDQRGKVLSRDWRRTTLNGLICFPCCLLPLRNCQPAFNPDCQTRLQHRMLGF